MLFFLLRSTPDQVRQLRDDYRYDAGLSPEARRDAQMLCDVLLVVAELRDAWAWGLFATAWMVRQDPLHDSRA